jgi:hypothetical protein
MTDNFLILIPTDPRYIPHPDSAQAANEYLVSVLPTEDIIWIASDSVTFVDCGNNFERVSCPACGRELAIPVWQQMMDAAYETEFADLTVTMPCCGAVGSLNDLHYEWPAGFASFSLEVLNPTTDLDEQQIAHVESLLGCSLRKIWRSL